MSTHVISGFGYVGKATQLSLLEAGVLEHNIAINDPYQNHIVVNWKEKQWHFICVPTPSEDLEHVSPYVGSVVTETINMAKQNGFEGITVLRSTLDPQSVMTLHEDLGDNLIVWPEFLRKASWSTDAVNPILSIAGGRYANDLNSSFSDSFKIKNVLSNPVEACIAKLAINSLLAARTIQAYNLKKLCDNLGYSYTRVQSILCTEPRLGYSHWQQPGPDGEYGYGGSCFPKDTSAMAYAMIKADVHDSYAEWAHWNNVKVKQVETPVDNQ